MLIFVDLDGTLCETEGANYMGARPKRKMIEIVNALHASGSRIVIWTARGRTTGWDWEKLTRQQLAEWGIKYDELRIGDKPEYDFLIDDKAHNVKEVEAKWKT